MIFSSHVISSSSPKLASLPRFKPSYISQDLQSDFLFEELKKKTDFWALEYQKSLSALSVVRDAISARKKIAAPLVAIRASVIEFLFEGATIIEHVEKAYRLPFSYLTTCARILFARPHQLCWSFYRVEMKLLLTYLLTNERNTLRHLLGSLSFFCNIST